MKLIIAGTRTFTDYDLIKAKLDYLTQNIEVTEVVSGTCRGVDKLGERWAKERGIAIKRFPPDWSLGKKAGPLRNMAMAEYSDALFLCWDGKSRGSANMLATARLFGLKVRVYKY